MFQKNYGNVVTLWVAWSWPPGKMPLLLGRKQDPDIGLEKSVLAIPPLLAVGAVHHYLIQQGLRTMSYFFFHVFHHIFGSPPKITRLLMFIDVYAFGIRRRSDLESRLGIDLRYSALVVIWYPAMIYRVWKQVDVTKRGVGGIWRLQLPFIPGTQASLVVSTGQCWSTHHFACLIGCWDLFLGTGLYRIGSL